MMYRFGRENFRHLQTHNIRISQFNPVNMSTPPAPRKVIHLPKVRMLPRTQGRPSIRITNVKSIKPPDPEAVKKHEEEKLRAQLQKEIVSRSRPCSYKRYKCPLPVVSGRAYCTKHITSDPKAPYAVCSHDRCSMPAPKLGQDQLCFEHARASLLARQRATAPPPPVASTETLLNQLQHYVRPERTRTTSCASAVSVVSEPNEQEILPHAVDPFKQIDARAVNAAYSASIMECGSASDSEADSIIVDGTDPGDGDGTEGAPQEESPLWRAGVFTAEEAVGEAEKTLKALQDAYIGQMGRLKTMLQTARLNYLRALKAEREQYCSIWSWQSVGVLTARERRQLRKLKAYQGHRRGLGPAAPLRRKLQRKRDKINEPLSNRPVPSQGRCTFSEGGVRCPAHVLPAAKHCLKHIVHDRHQVLFHPCGDLRGGVSCREPIPRLPLPSNSCTYHTDPPTYVVFTPKKDDSDSESLSGDSTDTETMPGGQVAIEDSPATPQGNFQGI